jgi:hypothetical protein
MHYEVARFNMSAVAQMEGNRKEYIKEFIERLKSNALTFLRHDGDEYLASEMANLAVSRCYACQGYAVWVEDRRVYPVRETTIAAHEDMPPTIREDFDEAAAIVNKSPRGAAALMRLCIQKLMPVLGEKGENINDDIASLVQKGLESEIQQAMDVLRVIGNNAVHPGKIDLKDDKAIAVRLFELLNLIIERRITTPKRIASLYGTLPAGSIKAIEKRDKGGGP